VDKLTRPFTLVADRRLEPEAAKLAHPDPLKDPRHRRERHVQDLSDFRAGEPHPPQRGDRLNPLLTGSVRDPMRRGGAITQPELPLGAVAPHPLAGAANTDSGGLGRLRQRPLSLNHSPAELPPAFQTERRVSVQIHSVSSLVD
jgi:hypothetical protein